MRRTIVFFWICFSLVSLWSEYWPDPIERKTWVQAGSPIDPEEVGGVQRKKGPVNSDEVGGVQRKKGPIDSEEVGGIQRNPNEIGNTPDPDQLLEILKKPGIQPSLPDQFGK